MVSGLYFTLSSDYWKSGKASFWWFLYHSETVDSVPAGVSPRPELGAQVWEAEAGSTLLLFAVLVSNVDTH